MKTTLAGMAFLVAAVAFLACLAVAFDELGLTYGVLPMFRANGGLTPAGLLALLIAAPLGALSLWAGVSLTGSDKTPPSD